MKSVPNLISYLHDFFWNFYQFLTIYFELFSSRSKFNSKITDMRGPPVIRRFPRRARLSVRRRHVAAAPHRSRALRALSGPRAGVPTGRSSRAVASPHVRSSRPRCRPCPEPTVAVRTPPPSRALPR
jgi:hypothetical protein